MEFNSYMELLEHLGEKAKRYDPDDAWLYIHEQGWDDWMADFVEDPEAEILTEQDSRAIRDVLADAFEHAHKIHFSRRERTDLIWD
jgi:hypothetical protein